MSCDEDYPTRCVLPRSIPGAPRRRLSGHLRLRSSLCWCLRRLSGGDSRHAVRRGKHGRRGVNSRARRRRRGWYSRSEEGTEDERGEHTEGRGRGTPREVLRPYKGRGDISVTSA